MDAVEVLFEIACSIKSILQSDFDEIEHLKEGEVRCIVLYLLPKDVFAVLPTGFGKLIIFQMIPSVCSLLSARGFDYPKGAVLVIVCPLVSLINSHVAAT